MIAADRRFCSRIWKEFGTKAEDFPLCRQSRKARFLSVIATRSRQALEMNLKPFLRGGSIVSWSDEQIAAGSECFL